MNAEQHPPEPDYRAYAAAGARALQRWYRPSRGLWQGAGWWQSANALTAVIRYAQAHRGPGGHGSGGNHLPARPALAARILQQIL